jgi:hypothetical protein
MQVVLRKPKTLLTAKSDRPRLCAQHISENRQHCLGKAWYHESMGGTTVTVPINSCRMCSIVSGDLEHGCFAGQAGGQKALVVSDAGSGAGD